MGYLVVEDVEVGDWLCNLFSPHPSPLPWGEGTWSGAFAFTPALSLRERGIVVALGVGEAVLDEVLCGFEAVVELGVCVLSLHGVHEEGGDHVAVACALVDFVLY